MKVVLAKQQYYHVLRYSRPTPNRVSGACLHKLATSFPVLTSPPTRVQYSPVMKEHARITKRIESSRTETTLDEFYESNNCRHPPARLRFLKISKNCTADGNYLNQALHPPSEKSTRSNIYQSSYFMCNIQLKIWSPQLVSDIFTRPSAFHSSIQEH